ncbi:MAG: hypothetical protein JWP89_1628 [Schlesneria sp.]|nr:hypothetical protein [Schlesneria sp.]
MRGAPVVCWLARTSFSHEETELQVAVADFSCRSPNLPREWPQHMTVAWPRATRSLQRDSCGRLAPSQGLLYFQARIGVRTRRLCAAWSRAFCSRPFSLFGRHQPSDRSGFTSASLLVRRCLTFRWFLRGLVPRLLGRGGLSFWLFVSNPVRHHILLVARS